MKLRSFTCMLTLAMILTLCVGFAAAVEIGGVELPDTFKVDDKIQLVLNGVGLRTVYGFKVYAGALYLQNKSSESEKIISNDETMAIKMRWRRGATVKKIEKVFYGSFQQAAGNDYAKYEKDVDKFMSWVAARKTTKAFSWTFIYRPDQGTTVYIDDGETEKEMGVLKGLPFKKILFTIWFGEEPCDAKLKNKMLGIQ